MFEIWRDGDIDLIGTELGTKATTRLPGVACMVLSKTSPPFFAKLCTGSMILAYISFVEVCSSSCILNLN